MSDKYILDDKGLPVEEPDMLVWARWFETMGKQRIVAHTTIGDDVYVSTVFLGLDHSFGAGPSPVLWETMVFGGPHDQYQKRYCSREEAERGHQKAVEMVQGVGVLPQ